MKAQITIIRTFEQEALARVGAIGQEDLGPIGIRKRRKRAASAELYKLINKYQISENKEVI